MALALALGKSFGGEKKLWLWREHFVNVKVYVNEGGALCARMRFKEGQRGGRRKSEV